MRVRLMKPRPRFHPDGLRPCPHRFPRAPFPPGTSEPKRSIGFGCLTRSCSFGVLCVCGCVDDTRIETWAAQFERDGFLALPKFFSEEEIDRALAAAEQLKRERPHEIVVDDLAVGERTFLAAARDPQHGRFKFNDLYLQLSEVRDLALSPILSRLLRALLHGDRPVLCFSLNFVQGSAQPIHIDSLYMTPKTQAHLVATWTALEDVHPDAGPLVYYPGSHKIPLYTFSDGTHHARQDEMPGWTAYVEREMQSRGITAQTFLARKGDLFIWHSDLVHGGSAI